MDILTFIAGLLAASVVIGHFTMGIKRYLGPMLGADFEKVSKATMQCAFHYVSVFLVLAAVCLILAGLKVLPEEKTSLLVKSLGLNYLLFAIVQVVYALRNKIEKPLVKMFQWTLFIPIGVLCLI